MLRLMCVVFITTLVVPAVVDGFYISWYPEYAPARMALSRKPTYYYKSYTFYKPRSPKLAGGHQGGSVMIEDNEFCSKFKCDRKKCCSGECINVFGMQMCIVLSNNSRFGRR